GRAERCRGGAVKSANTIIVTVHMAGDIDTAKRWLRRRSYERGLCVTVQPTTFVYTGGEEAGFSVGLVNYPKFPSDAASLCNVAREIAHGLIVECCQRTALVVGPDVTEWMSIKP